MFDTGFIKTTLEGLANTAIIKAELAALNFIPKAGDLFSKPDYAAKWLLEQVEALDNAIPLADTPWADELERIGVQKVVQLAFDKLGASVNALTIVIQDDLKKRGAISVDPLVPEPTIT
jgi:hypothetical protein